MHPSELSILLIPPELCFLRVEDASWEAPVGLVGFLGPAVKLTYLPWGRYPTGTKPCQLNLFELTL